MAKKRLTGDPIKQYDSFFEAADAVIQKKSNSKLGELMTPTVRGYNTGYGKSSYDKTFNWNADAGEDVQESLNEHRAAEQGFGMTALAGAGRAATKAVAETAKLPGVVLGVAAGLAGNALDAATGEDDTTFVQTAFNNWWIKGIDDINKEMNDDLMPVYVRKAVADGDIYDKVFSSEFWATDGADGLGYALGMILPGALLGKLGLGAKLVGQANKMEKYAEIYKAADRAEDFVNAASKIGAKARNIDSSISVGYNTLAEAGAEAKEFGNTFRDPKHKAAVIEKWDNPKFLQSESYQKASLDYFAEIDEKRKNGELTVEQANQLTSDPEAIKQAVFDRIFEDQASKGELGVFGLNAVILLGPNALMHQRLFGRVGRSAEQITESGAKETGLKGVMKQVGKKAAKYGKVAGINTLSEGYWEEGLQSTASNMLRHYAEDNKIDGLAMNFNIGDLAKEYADMIGSTEGKVAVMLGAVLGTGMSGISTHFKTKQENKIKNAILNRVDVSLNSFNTSFNTADIYERDEEGKIVMQKDADGNILNKPQINEQKAADLVKSLATNDLEQILYTAAIDKNATDFIRAKQEEALFQMVLPAVFNGEKGIQLLKQQMDANKDFQDIVARDQDPTTKIKFQDVVKKAVATAEHLQKENDKFNDFSSAMINLKDDRLDTSKESKEWRKDYLNELNQRYLNSKFNIFNNEARLKELEKQRDNVIQELNLQMTPEELLSNALLVNNTMSTNPLFKKTIEDINETSHRIRKDKNDIAEVWDGKSVEGSFKDYVSKRIEAKENAAKIAEVQSIIDRINSATTVKELDAIETEDEGIKLAINKKKALLKVEEESRKSEKKKESKKSNNRKKEAAVDDYQDIADMFEEGDNVFVDEENKYLGLDKSKLEGNIFTVKKIDKEGGNIIITDGANDHVLSLETLSKIFESNPEANFSSEGGFNPNKVQQPETVTSQKDAIHTSVDSKLVTVDPATNEAYPWIDPAAVEFERVPRDKKGEQVEFSLNVGQNDNVSVSNIEKELFQKKNFIEINDDQQTLDKYINDSSYYRYIGQEGLVDALLSKVLRQKGSKENVAKYSSIYFGQGLKGFKETVDFSDKYNEEFPIIAIIPKDNMENAGIESTYKQQNIKTKNAVKTKNVQYFTLIDGKPHLLNIALAESIVEKDNIKINKTSNLSTDQQKAVDMINNKDFSNIEFLANHLPLDAVLSSGAKATVETYNEATKDKFERTSLPMRRAIVMELAKGTPISSITTTIAGQNNGDLQIDVSTPNVVAENSLLGLYEISNDIKKITMENLYIVDDLGNLINGKGQKWAATRRLAKGEIYLRIHTANGTPFPLKLNVNKINELQAEALYELYKYRFEDIKERDKATLLVNLPQEAQDVIKSNLSQELELFEANGQKYDSLTLKDVIDFLIWDGSQNPKSQVRFSEGKLKVGTAIYTQEEFEDSKEDFINRLTSDNARIAKRHHIRFKDKKGGVKALTIDNPNRLYLEYIINNGILNTNAAVNTPSFQGNTSIYLTPDNVRVNGTVSEFNPEVKRDIFKDIIGSLDAIQKKLPGLFKFRFKLDGKVYKDRYNNSFERVSTLKSKKDSKDNLGMRNSAKRGDIIDSAFRDFFLDTKFHNLDEFIKMFHETVKKVNKERKETNPVEFSEDVIIKLFQTFNSYAQLFKDNDWKVYASGFTVGGFIGNLGPQNGRYAGTTDFLVEDNKSGQRYIIDIKTSSVDRVQLEGYNGEEEDTYGIVEDDKIQLNTYAYLAEQMDPNANIAGLYILPITIKAEEKSYNREYSDAELLNDFDPDNALLEVDYEKGNFHEVLNVDEEDLIRVKKEAPKKSKGKGRLNVSGVKGGTEDAGLAADISALDPEGTPSSLTLNGLQAFLDAIGIPATVTPKAATTTTAKKVAPVVGPSTKGPKVVQFNVGQVLMSSGVDLEAVDYLDADEVEVDGNTYFVNRHGERKNRFSVAKEVGNAHSFDFDLSIELLNKIGEAYSEKGDNRIEKEMIKETFDDAWKSRLNSVSLQKEAEEKPSTRPVVKPKENSTTEERVTIINANNENRPSDNIDFSKLNEEQAKKAFQALMNLAMTNPALKTKLGKISLEARKNVKTALLNLIKLLENNGVSKEEIQITCK